ncbi:MAG: hypothetical protein QNJ60_08955 [Xenococcaceae cyanobacterium MO_188.B19]|nr:hypothetical protein [Xenococcaceae cyanobacterium MO_188.B19]
MIELLYLTSQIQCGVNGDFLNIQVDVYQNQELIRTISQNESLLLPVDSINDLRFEYYTVNNTTSCSLSTPSEQLLTSNDPIPNISGVYEQQSIQTMLDGLNNYEELFLVELGTVDQTSPAFDLQDVVFIVNNNPVIFAD